MTVKPQDVWWRRLLQNEPVLVGTLVPILTTVGILTATQAATVTTVLAGVAAVAVQLVGATAVRAHVTPVKKATPAAPADAGHIDLALALLIAVFIIGLILVLAFFGVIHR